MGLRYQATKVIIISFYCTFKHSKTIIGNPISLNSSIKMNLGIREASDIYGKRMHNLCCDNCHSHVATALGRIIACYQKEQ